MKCRSHLIPFVTIIFPLALGNWSVGALATATATAQRTDEPITPDPSSVEFFERDIRPLFVVKCQSCHGINERKGGLSLTSRAAMLKGGGRGPAVIPGKPTESLLLRAVRQDGDLKMPPNGKLSAMEIEKLTRWVVRGAVWSDSATGKATLTAGNVVTEQQRRWWAFRPVRTVPVPTVSNRSWPRSDLDRFILAELEQRSISPAQPAERRVLLRRVTFDLTGLPPTPEEVEAFLRDESPDAWERVVDRLLASPAYGQHWARHWLDVVRYADYHDGNPKARNPVCEPLEAWRYRDWVVRSLNHDLPFDRFIVHQIAGDLLPAPEGQEPYADGLIATTFLVNGAWDRGDADKEKMVSDMVDDQIDTVGKAFMGLTLGCARCHDHKFDPITQTDYYALAGIFYSTRMLAELGTKGGEITLQRRPLVSRDLVEIRARQVKQIADLNVRLAEMDKRTPKPAPADPVRTALVAQRDRLQQELPPEPPMALAVSEGGVPGGLFTGIQDVPVHIRGSYTRLGEIVPRRMPRFLAGDRQPRITGGSGRRELAHWVASSQNPLTARVIVNRVWQWHFGTGLVRTPNNLGLLSEPPSHAELLDWLAARFIEDGWSLKQLHRRIVRSATYRQASVISKEQLVRDPENRWLGRFTPRRLTAEAIRDSLLAVAGRLDRTAGGPATHDLHTTRRSLYVQTARWDRSNFATLFDAANPDASVEKREVSTVAPQALFLLNHGFVVTQAKHLSERVTRGVPDDPVARIRRLFQLVFARPPTAEELKLAQWMESETGKADWPALAHVLLCSSELIYLD